MGDTSASATDGELDVASAPAAALLYQICDDATPPSWRRTVTVAAAATVSVTAVIVRRRLVALVLLGVLLVVGAVTEGVWLAFQLGAGVLIAALVVMPISWLVAFRVVRAVMRRPIFQRTRDRRR